MTERTDYTVLAFEGLSRPLHDLLKSYNNEVLEARRTISDFANDYGRVYIVWNNFKK
jgi:hypothetical protein